MEYQSIEDLMKEGYREEDVKQFSYNTCTNKTGHHYIRILKSFKSPHLKNLTEAEDKFMSPLLMKDYVLRFHLPKKAMGAKKSTKSKETSKIEHVVIMVNGVNEFTSTRFDFYDFMASHFAEKGIASVLFSTPYHMHRVAINPESERKHFVNPSDVLKDDINLFLHYKYSSLDLETLAKKIKGLAENDVDGPEGEDFGFYKNHFSENVKVTILGYSLGGLISLGTVVRTSEEKSKIDENQKLVLDQDDDIIKVLDNRLFDNCILYNTAPKLADAKTEEILGKGFCDRLIKREFSNDVREDNPNNSDYDEAFEELYVGPRHKGHISIKNFIRDNTKKFLLVMSGNDGVVNRKAWNDYLNEEDENRPRKHLINEFIMAGVGHSPLNEAQGAESLPRVLEIMADHILRNQKSHFQAAEIVEMMFPFLHKSEYLKRVTKGEEQSYNSGSFDRGALMKFLADLEVRNPGKKEEFEKVYYLSKIYFPKFSDLVKAILKRKPELETKNFTREI